MNLPVSNVLVVLACAIALTAAHGLAADEVDHLRLVTYGPEANTREGDDDFVQVVLLDVPATTPGPIRVRVYDPDAGGELDVFYGWGAFDTATRYVVYGGAGATTAPGLRGADPSRDEIHGGQKLADRIFAEDADADESWVVVAELSPDQAERVGDRLAFKLVIEGVAGNDGNVFDVDIVGADGGPISGARMLSYEPTIHHDTKTRTAEVRILPSGQRRLFIHSFDAAGADLRIETLYRTLRADTSGQNKWSKSEIELTPEEQDQVIALAFGGRAGEIPNDATLYMADQDGVVVPIQLPISLIVPNRRPKVVTRVRPVDCTHAELDATKSTDAEGQALSFEWLFPDGTTSNDPVVTHDFGGPGTYTVRLRVTDDSGQVGAGTEVQVPVVLNHPPTAAAGEDQVAAPTDVLAFDGTGSADSDGRLRQYRWDFGDGNRTTGRKVRHAFDAPGRYTVTLEVEDDSKGPCAVGTDTLEVWVNEAPVAKAGHPDRGAVSEAFPFTAEESTDADGRLTKYEWDFGDGSTAEGSPVEHAFAESGTYEVRLTVTDDAGVGNSTTSATQTVFVNEPPIARAGDDREVAIDEPLELDAGASEDSDGVLVRYSWTFGDGTSAEGERVEHAYDAAGTYQVRLEVQDDSRTRSDTVADTLEVVVNAPPVAEAGPDQRVTESEVRFDATGSSDSDGEVVRYTWKFGDGATGEGARPLHVYAAPGTYRVDLEIADDSPTPRNTARDHLDVVVNARPVADAGPDRKAAVGQRVEFTAAASKDPDGRIERYAWDFGDGASAEGEVVTHTYGEPGAYLVQLTVHDDTGHAAAADHDDLRVMVNHAPVARLESPPRIAPGDVVRLDASRSFDPDGEIVRYAWTVDGREAGEGPSLEQTFDVPGSHAVELLVDDGTGTANATAQVGTTVHVNHAPVAEAGPDQTTCEPVVRLDARASTDADGDPLLYAWDFGDGTPEARGRQVAHVYRGGGSYPVALRVDDGTGLSNASARSELVVRVNGAPVARAGQDTTQCAGEVVLFDGSASEDPDGDALKYAWEFGDGNTASGRHPVHVYDQAGVYPVTLAVQDGSGLPCGEHRDQRVVRVVAAPVAVAGKDVETCANVDVVFDGSASQDAEGAIDRFSWDFGDGTRGSGPAPTHRYSRPGRYQVVLTVEGDPVEECDNTDVDELTVVVAAAPNANIEAPRGAVPGEAVSFTARGENPGDVRWAWSFGDGGTAEGPAVEHVFAEPGAYDVELVATDPASAQCGETRRTHRLLVNAPPVAMAGGDRHAAVGEAIAFSGQATHDPDGVITKYVWRFGDGAEAEGVSVFYAFAEPGEYTVSLTAIDDSGVANASSTAEIVVHVNAPPVPGVEAPTVACVGEEITLDASSTADPDASDLVYRWEIGDGTTAEGAVVQHAFERSGTFPVTVLVDDGSATASAVARSTSEVHVNRPPEARGGADRVVCVGEDVRFDGSASRDLDGRIVRYQWSFGDGAKQDGPIAVHRYEAPGRYEAALEVTDDSGSACAVTIGLVQVHVNHPPVVDLEPERTGFAGGAHDALLFDGRASNDADGHTLSYAWDFGDGSTATGPVVSHPYARPGTYTVRLRVDDGTGGSCAVGEGETRVVIAERAQP